MQRPAASSRPPRRIRWALAIPVLLGLLAAGAAAADWWICLPEGRQPGFVGRQACVDCHREEVERWQGSDHDLAMDLATPETVLGDFNDQTFTHHGVTTRFFRDGDRFMVTTDNARGELETFPIKYVFGVRPLQQYMIEFPDGRVQVLSIAWDVEGKRWFHLYPDRKIPAGDWHHWTGPGQNWNYMCAECHSTNLHKGFDLATNTYHTTFSEIDVSCEACHGPASLHVELANQRSLFWDRRYGYGLARLKGPSSKAQLETCAKCHSRRRIVHPDYSPGAELLDYYEPELLDGRLYHADGQIKEELYEYGSFLQSRMFREGVRCTDCHDPHSLQLRAEGNNLCTRCHTPGKYDTPAHHHHPIDSTGARCVECHMPTHTYMVVDPRRDHSLRVPRPDLSDKLGTPNACTGCHTHAKETNAWATQKVVEWYGPKRAQDPHFGEVLEAGRQARPEADEPLAKLAAGPLVPDKARDVGPVVRASAVALLGQYDGPRGHAAVERALLDPDPLVRVAAVRACERRPDAELVRLLAPLLGDGVRAVRTEAARLLSRVRREYLPVASQERFDAALTEWIEGQQATNDQAGTHVQLAVVYENQGRLTEAEAAYREALRLEPDFVPAMMNGAMLAHRQGRAGEAEALFRKAIAAAPAVAQSEQELKQFLAEAWYSLGLLLAEAGSSRMAEAAAALEESTRHDATRPATYYNLGLARQQLGQWPAAATALARAVELEPANPRNLFALALVYLEQGDLPRARETVSRLVQLAPRDPQVAALAERVQAAERTLRPQGPAAP